MLNQVVIVGRIVENDKDTLIIGVSRNYKNANGEYDKDNLKVVIKGTMQNYTEYFEIGNIIGVKGVLRNENGEIVIVAEKITMLSTHHN